jgi:hypothetical protein
MIAYAKIIMSNHIKINVSHFGASQIIFFTILLYHKNIIATAHINNATSHKNFAK